MIETLKEKRNLKNLAIKLQKVDLMKKNLGAQKKFRGAAALMDEPPLGSIIMQQQ